MSQVSVQQLLIQTNRAVADISRCKYESDKVKGLVTALGLVASLLTQMVGGGAGAPGVKVVQPAVDDGAAAVGDDGDYEDNVPYDQLELPNVVHNIGQ